MQACPAVKLHKDPLSPFHLVEVNLSLHTHTHTGEEEEKGRRVGVIPSFSWCPVRPRLPHYTFSHRIRKESVISEPALITNLGTRTNFWHFFRYYI